MNLLEQALKLAIMAFEEDKDFDGHPALIHYISVGFAGSNPDEIVTGILEDIFAKSNVTPLFLQATGIPQNIIEALHLLTKSKDQTNEDYLKNILQSGNELALRVKINDIRQNVNRYSIGSHKKEIEQFKKDLSFLTGGE